jgi:nicotinamide-nucleotide amidase
MLPMLDEVLGRFARTHAAHRELGVTGMPESDVQMAVQDVLAGREDVGFTVLASLGDVRILLTDLGAGDAALDSLVGDVAQRIGDAVYSSDGSSLAAETIRAATQRGVSLACAESCTGGLVGAALTEVPGASECFLGSVVTYANQAKIDLLDVPPGLLAQYGAVSEECARAMAEGARSRLNADIAVAVTGVAGPSGGTADKPVGLVWFAVADGRGSRAFSRKFGSSSRGAIRARATATALDSIRRALREA